MVLYQIKLELLYLLQHKTHKMKKLLFGIVLISLYSCANDTIEQDVQKYCDCIQKNRANNDGRQQCIDEMSAIITKYEYDPEASTKINKLVNDCH